VLSPRVEAMRVVEAQADRYAAHAQIAKAQSVGGSVKARS